jgi:hypothetical protein
MGTSRNPVPDVGTLGGPPATERRMIPLGVKNEDSV